MKYIRTKEGKIIDIDKRYQEHLNNGWINKTAKTKELFIRTGHYNIILQADTIEELCDEFVLYYLPLEEMSKNESWIPYAQYERLGVWQKMRDEIIYKTLKSKSILYGAIWTDKGLIYVAKMNDKGELELL